MTSDKLQPASPGEDEAERNYRQLFELAFDGIFISRPGGCYVEVNTRACEMTGYSRPELLSMRPEDLISPGSQTHRPVDWNAVVPGTTYRIECEVRRKDGMLVPVEVSAGLIEGGLLHAIVRDVTESRSAETELTHLKGFYENVLDQLPVQMAVLDHEGRYLYLNPAAVRDEERRRWMIGKTPAEYGRAFYADPTPFEARYRWVLQMLEGGEVHQHEETLTTRTGEERHFLRMAVPATSRDGQTQLIAFGIDLTERKRFEQQLIRAKEEAEQMNRLKSAFLANMSHEIRTPLTGIIGFSAVLAEEVGDEQREMARLIERGGTRLLDTLNSVLELSMLQAGSHEVQYRRLDVVDVARECVAYGQPVAGAKGLCLRLKTSVSALHCFLDEAGVARILHNLIGNAVKFTERGEVTVEVERDRDDVVLRVRDTGIGIDAGFLPLLFDEFRQESTGIKRTYEGAGLGLAITRHLVERLEGSISVESEKGCGSVFTVRLPCLQAAPAERPVPV